MYRNGKMFEIFVMKLADAQGGFFGLFGLIWAFWAFWVGYAGGVIIDNL